MPKSKQRCEELREETRTMILQKSLLYFAKNGFQGTKINDLSKYIGIAPGTMYIYFKSKEDLYDAIIKIVDCRHEVAQLKMLQLMPVKANKKIRILSEHILEKLQKDIEFAAKVAIGTQISLEEDSSHASSTTTYQSELYRYTALIIEQGQKEGFFVAGSSKKLADYYWGVVYLYSLKKLFTTSYEMITREDLERTIK